MNKVLILGASGLLGRAIVDQFIDKGYLMGALSRTPTSFNSIQVKEHLVDILDYKKLESVISEYDYIINCTGQITNPINHCLTLNTHGIQNIVDAVNKYNKKLLHFSSVAVYGSSEYVNEQSNLNPESAYACIKCFAEHAIIRHLKSSLIFRVCNLYGKDQNKGVVRYLSSQYLKRESELNFNNNGEMMRYYLNVSELAEITYLAVSTNLKPGVYNVIGSDLLTIKELVGKFKSILDFSFSTNYSTSYPIENIKKIDDLKIKSELSIIDDSPIDFYIKNIKDDK